MIRGLYTSGWSMLAIQKKMDVISNNMANASTNGYKKDTLVLETFPALLTKIIRDFDGIPPRSPRDIGTMELGNDVGEVFTYYSQGQLTKTDNVLDMAIGDSNNAFFTVAAVDGGGRAEVFYTRDGAFTKGAGNILLTKEGHVVLGENGPILLEEGDFIVSSDGTIIQNDTILDRLRISEFTDTGVLEKYGHNLVRAEGNAGMRAFTGTIQQGFIELSNVNIVREMVDMITVMRSYEANQKALQIMDSTLEKAVNEVGSVR